MEVLGEKGMRNTRNMHKGESIWCSACLLRENQPATGMKYRRGP